MFFRANCSHIPTDLIELSRAGSGVWVDVLRDGRRVAIHLNASDTARLTDALVASGYGSAPAQAEPAEEEPTPVTIDTAVDLAMEALNRVRDIENTTDDLWQVVGRLQTRLNAAASSMMKG